MKQKTRRTINNRCRITKFMQACADGLPVPVLTITCGENILSMNPVARQLFGIPVDDSVNPMLSDLFLVEDGQDSVIARAFREQNPVSGMLKICSAAGIREMNCSAVPFMGEDEEVLLVTLLFSEPEGKDGRCSAGSAGHPLSRHSCSEIPGGIAEWEKVLLAFSHGDLQTVSLTDPQDPLARLKYLYNEGIAAMQKMVSVKELFG